MPNKREKLIELFAVTSLEFEEAVTLADHLIANGVTVQKHGRWAWKPIQNHAWKLTCSVCSRTENASESNKFCPNCGAIMDLPNITEQTQSALEKMGRKAHGEE